MIIIDDNVLRCYTIEQIGIDLGMFYTGDRDSMEYVKYIESIINLLKLNKDEIPDFICLLESMYKDDTIE